MSEVCVYYTPLEFSLQVHWTSVGCILVDEGPVGDNRCHPDDKSIQETEVGGAKSKNKCSGEKGGIVAEQMKQ